jgi:hypothetical protein
LDGDDDGDANVNDKQEIEALKFREAGFDFFQFHREMVPVFA